jgi:hypothetical protein
MNKPTDAPRTSADTTNAAAYPANPAPAPEKIPLPISDPLVLLLSFAN